MSDQPADGSPRAKRSGQRPGRGAEFATGSAAHCDWLRAVKTLEILIEVHGTSAAALPADFGGFLSLTVVARLGWGGFGVDVAFSGVSEELTSLSGKPGELRGLFHKSPKSIHHLRVEGGA